MSGQHRKGSGGAALTKSWPPSPSVHELTTTQNIKEAGVIIAQICSHRERLGGELDKLSHNGKGTGREEAQEGKMGNWGRRDDKITATLASLFN